MINIRPFQPEDFYLLLDLANQAAPFALQENIVWLERRKSFDEGKGIRRHHIAEETGKPVGYSCLEQQGDNPKSLRVYVVSSPENLRGEVGEMLYSTLLQDAKELGTSQLWAQELEQDRPSYEFFTTHGFVEKHRGAPPGEQTIVVLLLIL